MKKTVYFKTLGCKVNQYETQGMREVFFSAGWKEVAVVRDAGVVVINSCTVTHHSDRKTMYYARQAKRQNYNAVVVVAGCIVENNDPEYLIRKGADIVVCNEDKTRIAALVEDYLFHGNKSVSDSIKDFHITNFKGHSRAFVKVQDGCNMRCSYCKICLVRGQSRSRDMHNVLSDVQSLVANGYKEIVLAGIQLGAYGRDFCDETDIVFLLQKIVKIKGCDRVRLSSIEPFDVKDNLIEFMSTNKKVCPQLHIPLQSGSDNILKLMRRGYTGKCFCRLIEKLRARIPNFAFTTDVIVGFPSESDENFDDTVQVLSETRPFKVHVFPFSAREGTDAAKMKDQVSLKIVKKREKSLLGLEKKIFADEAGKFVGQICTVLLEEELDNKGQFLLKGRVPQYMPIIVSGAAKENIGGCLKVKVLGVQEHCLTGEVVTC